MLMMSAFEILKKSLRSVTQNESLQLILLVVRELGSDFLFHVEVCLCYKQRGWNGMALFQEAK